MVLLNIAGGVALILFGIRFLRKGLERLLGHGLHSWLERMAQRPWTAALAGAVFGTIAPSSTAQTLLTLQLLNAGKLAAGAMLAFLLGANVGITVTVQLIAFRFFDYYALFLVVGLVCFQYFKSENVRGVGQSVLGLGFIFLAMELASGSGRILAADGDFQTVLGVLVHHRLWLVVFAALLTLVTQSSTAAIGLALALGESGALSLPVLLPVVLGANLGLGLTSLVAGFATWEGRRLAAANLVLKCSAIIAVLALYSLVEPALAATPGSVARQTANFHTGFNVLVMLVGIFLAGPLGRLMQRAVRPGSDPAAAVRPVATHLDPAALASPAFALANATRETLRLADGVKSMFEGAWRALNDRNAALAAEVQRHDDRIDELNTAIKLYLSRIPNDALNPRDSQLQFGLLNFSSQLESIGDIIDKSMCGAVIKHAHTAAALPPEDQADLQALYERVLRRMDAAISVLATRDRALAEQFLQEGDDLKNWCIEIQKRHYQRIAPGDPRAVESSAHFLDLVNVLRRISGQLNTIGHTFVLQKTAPATDAMME
ncbi:MAG TPA: Na/Pi cotransporter family protein [Opitutaceae bacterium]|nr:Na/Pi cotransporter family protein [Opitutaceae bacterium]